MSTSQVSDRRTLPPVERENIFHMENRSYFGRWIRFIDLRNASDFVISIYNVSSAGLHYLILSYIKNSFSIHNEESYQYVKDKFFIRRNHFVKELKADGPVLTGAKTGLLVALLSFQWHYLIMLKYIFVGIFLGILIKITFVINDNI